MELESLFAQKKELIKSGISRAIVEHVGGTAIPGAITKGDLDISVQVIPEDFPQAVEYLKTLFSPIHVERLWRNYFAVFRDEEGTTQIDIMLVVIGSPFDRFVYIRDRLRTDVTALGQYNALKKQYGKIPDEAYRSLKHAFFDDLEKKK